MDHGVWPRTARERSLSNGDQGDPSTSLPRSDEERATQLCEQANHLFTGGKYKGAVRKYGEALLYQPSPELRVRIMSNRAASLLKLQRYEDALVDANDGLRIDTTHVKLRYRKITALLYLQRPVEAKTECDDALILVLSTADRTNQDAFHALSEDVDVAIDEQQGSFDLREMKKQVGNEPKPLSRKHQDFVSPDLLLQSAGDFKGRGWFISRFIQPGELLLAEKAYAYAAREQDAVSFEIDMYSRRLNAGSQTHMVSETVQTLIASPATGKDLYSLAAGSEYSDPVSQEDIEKVDVMRIDKILSSNWFSTSMENNISRAVKSQRDELLNKSELTEVEKGGTGLWIKASFFNNSCSPNCEFLIIGDFIFVISIKSIRENDEVTISYCGERGFEERSKIFAAWNQGDGFTCQCDVCRYLRKEPIARYVDYKINGAYDQAAALCSMGLSMSVAAEIALAEADVNEIIVDEGSVPPEGQVAYQRLLELRSFAAVGSVDDGLGLLQAAHLLDKTLEVIERVQGYSPSSLQRLMVRFRMATLAVPLGRTQVIETALAQAYAIVCLPPFGLFEDSDFETLAERYIADDVFPYVRPIVKRVIKMHETAKKQPSRKKSGKQTPQAAEMPSSEKEREKTAQPVRHTNRKKKSNKKKKGKRK